MALLSRLGLHVQRTYNRLRLHCTHIAIGTRGIYIDEIDTASSICLKRRTKVAFDDIESCQIQNCQSCQVQNCPEVYRIDNIPVESRCVITVCLKNKCRYRNGTFIGPPIVHTIEGIQNQQRFVDIVNAMMRRRVTRRVDNLSGPTYRPWLFLIYASLSIDKLVDIYIR